MRNHQRHQSRKWGRGQRRREEERRDEAEAEAANAAPPAPLRPPGEQLSESSRQSLRSDGTFLSYLLKKDSSQSAMEKTDKEASERLVATEACQEGKGKRTLETGEDERARGERVAAADARGRREGAAMSRAIWGGKEEKRVSGGVVREKTTSAAKGTSACTSNRHVGAWKCEL